MREILEQCVKLDDFAHETYRVLADATDDDELKRTLTTLAKEEGSHAEWWQELVRSWDDGLLPDILDEPAGVMSELDRRWDDLRRVVPDDPTGLEPREIVAIAAQLEFFMLLPVFGELIDLVEPAQAVKRHRAYNQHLGHLIEAIEQLAGDDPLVGFLARVLQRVAEDNRSLTKHATHDGLTGLRNRRSLDGQLRQWLAWSQRYGRPLGVFLADLDEFKEINDGHGHETGDKVLITVARALEDTVRGSDMVARYGGDEFAVIAPETDVPEATALCERLVSALQGLTVDSENGQVAVSISIGCAVIEPNGKHVTPERALSTADRSLYEAKEAGRNRAGTVRGVG